MDTFYTCGNCGFRTTHYELHRGHVCDRGDGCVAPPCSAASGVERPPSLSAAVPPDEAPRLDISEIDLLSRLLAAAEPTLLSDLVGEVVCYLKEQGKPIAAAIVNEIDDRMLRGRAVASEPKPEDVAFQEWKSEWEADFKPKTEASGRRNAKEQRPL